MELNFMGFFKKITMVLAGLYLSGTALAVENDVMSFMITNENMNRGEIKIKQRAGDSSPYLIVGCNSQSDDFYVLLGNLSQKEFKEKSYPVNVTFKNKSYRETFIPKFTDDKFYLTKKTNQEKDNQLFVYQFLKQNQVILDFGKNTTFYFNAKSNGKFLDNMNIIISHCGLKL